MRIEHFSLVNNVESGRIYTTLMLVALFIFFGGGCEKTTDPKTVENPGFSHEEGVYDSAINVTVSCSTDGAVIRYTVDGNDPDESSTLYTGSIEISASTTLKARAYKAGFNASQIVTVSYTIILPSVNTPTFNPPEGSYGTVQNVTITSTTPNATIRYTTNGSEPTASSASYSSPIAVNTTMTIKAKGFKEGLAPSSTASASYTINLPSVEAPTFNPSGAYYITAQNVTISIATPNAEIRYTTNGTEPTEASTIYSNPISVNTTTTIKAKGFKDGWAPSSTASATYTIGSIPPPSVFILVQGGTFSRQNPEGDYPNPPVMVTLASFYIDKYEVTQASYRAVMGTNPSYFQSTNRPVERVSWFSAIEFCNRRSILEGLTPCYSYGSFGTNPSDWPSGWNSVSANHTNVGCNWTANGYRLPTEMEWMFAAKGGNQSQNYTYSGSNDIDAVAWYIWNSNTGTGRATHTVGGKNPNELGTFDMSGNVFEWVWDIYGTYTSGNQTNPTGPVSGTNRVLRGGSWEHYASDCWVYKRKYLSAITIDNNYGFRCVRTSLNQ
ncbi:MAG: chitobiase/beta-hexosaminidase C-terminal domain-containing protein [Candidatus Cloacimonadaceae bacterium]|nr:chitobiase/beta-hexosaminidase C-terminal domain-containing protein [Candidatus Cloacimonadaceae bacterium]